MSKKLKKLDPPKKPVRGKNGGARPGSGRKPLASLKVINDLKQELSIHASTMVDVTTKEGRILKLTRLQILLDTLYKEAVESKNVSAIKEYLDRMFGKSVQPIQGPGDEGEFTCKIVGYDIAKYNLKK